MEFGLQLSEEVKEGGECEDRETGKGGELVDMIERRRIFLYFIIFFGILYYSASFIFP